MVKMFDHFPQSEIQIVAADGSIRGSTKAIIDGATATIPNATVVIVAGDEIRRKLPNGTEETFEVIDPVFHEKLRVIPAHFQVKIRRKGTFRRAPAVILLSILRARTRELISHPMTCLET